jgi:hypothetical protein
LFGRVFVFAHDAEITLLPRQGLLDLGTLLLGIGFAQCHGPSSLSVFIGGFNVVKLSSPAAVKTSAPAHMIEQQ